MRSKFIQYFVEGEDEVAVVNTLKSKMRLIKAGKVHRLNAVEQEITDARLRTLKPQTMVVLVFDTDTGNRSILDKNIQKLNACSNVSEVVLIPQVSNIEDELVRSCDIRNIPELLNSKTNSDFKRDVIKVSNLDAKLNEHDFSINTFWSHNAPTPYQDIPNQSNRIKL